MTSKKHVPSESAVGLIGPALCGRWTRYGTGDHAQIRRTALEALEADGLIGTGDEVAGRPATAHYCAHCLARLV